MSTQAARIADLVVAEKAGEPVTVYATYASLERIVQAHQLHGLPAWDLVVVDEAHRTAGSDGKAWAAVHADDQVPAKRRLYFTATPRIVDETRIPHEVVDVAEGTVICSMDDERIYGKTGRSYRRLLAYLAAGGTLTGPANRTGGEADPAFRPGIWLRKQDKARTDGKLTDHQTALLDALHRHAEAVTG
ncbi:DEAD/DEAH box helicase family protein [Kitasatospora sp. NPDC101155]|uniref:helicase associated domain-containing protein n=1 Tax=Kitasatospora sp. NPDC101155 TaxID=3364097 RepID=UPI00380304DA